MGTGVTRRKHVRARGSHVRRHLVLRPREEAHLFCLTKPAGSEHGWDIGHLVSRDLRTWDDAGTALRRGAPGAWDDKGLATGSVIEHGGSYWMAYTGHHSGDPHMVQRVGMAFSADLHHWEKIDRNPVTEAAPPHYELLSSGKRVMVHWRDPFLLADGERVLQLVCARRTDGDPTSRGTVGVAETRDMRRWTLLPPLEHDRTTEEMEVPQVYRIGGRCYLVFCTIAGDSRVPDMLSPSFTRRFPAIAFAAATTAWSAHHPRSVPDPRHRRDLRSVAAHGVRKPARQLPGPLVPARNRACRGRRPDLGSLPGHRGRDRRARDRHQRLTRTRSRRLRARCAELPTEGGYAAHPSLHREAAARPRPCANRAANPCGSGRLRYPPSRASDPRTP